MNARTTWRQAWIALALTLAVASPASAQYFGQNKVQYKSFDFEVLKTQHFDIYFYAEAGGAAGRGDGER